MSDMSDTSLVAVDPIKVNDGQQCNTQRSGIRSECMLTKMILVRASEIITRRTVTIAYAIVQG